MKWITFNDFVLGGEREEYRLIFIIVVEVIEWMIV